VFAVAQKDSHHLVFGQVDGTKHIEMKPDGSLVQEVTDAWEDGTVCGPKGRWHHESLLQPDEKVYFLGSEIRGVDINGTVRPQTGDTINVWDQKQGTVSTLASLFDFLDPRVNRTPASNHNRGDFYWHGCDRGENSEDWTHSNALWVDDKGSFVVSIRHLNQIISISPDLETIQWRLGGIGSDFTFPDPNDRFYHQHSAKVLPNGNILLFDNGNGRPPPQGGPFSRALELELDMTTMQARKVWEYRHSPSLFAACCSSVQRLDNENTVMIFGADHLNDVCCRTFTLVEADSKGNAVFIMWVSSRGQAAQYRAYALDSINGETKK
ncbi:MAG: aryl-sulfate sulfotransferase, partial [Dehalococcoidia bacterium]